MKYAAYGVVAIIIAIATFAVVKKVSPVSWGWWGEINTTSGVALQGYDPVEYFGSQSAVKGDKEITQAWRDATWHFANATNKKLFVADPEKYAPEFGGFCAFAVSKGFTADPDPEAWYVHQNQLFVFADKKVRDQWVEGLAEGSLQESQSKWAKR